MKYRQSSGFMLKNVSGEDILIARGRTALKVNGVFVFNSACSVLWNQLDSSKTVDELADLFQDEYHISRETAVHDIEICLKEMLENGMIESVSD